MTSPAETSIDTTRIGTLRWEAALAAIRRNGSRIGIWALPFVLIVYLGLKGGGYDSIVRGEVGVAVWWIVILGVAISVLPSGGIDRNGWIGLGLLTSFALWTGIGIAWSADAGGSVTEFARVATYLGVFALVLTARRPGDMRRLVNGLAAGMAAIGILALLSRLHPSWFPTDDTNQILTTTQSRLNYPLDYWNGLATLMAMAIPLLLFVAVRGRTVVGRVAGAAATPAVALTAFLTLSRGGAIEIAVALVVFISLAPRRLEAMPTVALAAVGSAILILATNQRDALTNGADTPLAHHQGHEILAMALVVCAGVGLVQMALAVAARHELGPRIRVRRRATTIAWVGIALCALVVAVGV